MPPCCSDESASALRLGGIGRALIPFIQIDAAAPGLTWGINGEERLNALAFTADSEGIEKLVPALRSLFQIRSLRTGLEPSVQLDCHWCKKLPLVHSISQMIAEGAAERISWRPDLDRRHSLSDSVYNLPGSSLGFSRAGPCLFESRVEIRKRLVFRGGRLAGRRRRTRFRLPPTLLRSCHEMILAERPAWANRGLQEYHPAEWRNKSKTVLSLWHQG